MRRVFFRKEDGFEVVDVTGTLSVDAIKAAYGDGTYDTKDIEDGKPYTFKDGKVVDYVHIETDDEKKEKLIKKEMDAILREQAVSKLKSEGKI